MLSSWRVDELLLHLNCSLSDMTRHWQNTEGQKISNFAANMSARLHKTQELLYDSTRDFLALRFEHRDNEKRWMVEKDRLLQELDACHQQLKSNHRHSTSYVLDVSRVHEEILSGPLARQGEFKVYVLYLWCLIFCFVQPSTVTRCLGTKSGYMW